MIPSTSEIRFKLNESYHLKLFVRVFTTLQKLGEDVSLCFERHKLILRSLNASHSSYSMIEFQEGYFEEYMCLRPRSLQVKLRPVCAAFRSLNNVTACEWTVAQDDAAADADIKLTMHCQMNCRKEFKIAAEDGDEQQVAQPGVQMSQIVAPPKYLLECMNNFQAGLEEISLVAVPECMTLKSHFNVNNMHGGELIGQGLKTELEVNRSEFTVYDVPVHGAEITFGLKEFKAILSLGEFLVRNVDISFDSAGRPLIMRLPGQKKTFEAFFVLATTVDAPIEQAAMQHAVASQAKSQHLQQQSQLRRAPASAADLDASLRASVGAAGLRASASASASANLPPGSQRQSSQQQQKQQHVQGVYQRPPVDQFSSHQQVVAAAAAAAEPRARHPQPRTVATGEAHKRALANQSQEESSYEQTQITRSNEGGGDDNDDGDVVERYYSGQDHQGPPAQRRRTGGLDDPHVNHSVANDRQQYPRSVDGSTGLALSSNRAAVADDGAPAVLQPLVDGSSHRPPLQQQQELPEPRTPPHQPASVAGEESFVPASPTASPLPAPGRIFLRTTK